jgi:hypothetical protein
VAVAALVVLVHTLIVLVGVNIERNGLAVLHGIETGLTMADGASFGVGAQSGLR